MGEVFGYPRFDETKEMLLTTYDGPYSEMQMDIRVYQIAAKESRIFFWEWEEAAFLLLSGKVIYEWQTECVEAARKDVFCDGPWCLHVCKGQRVKITALAEAEILVQCTRNEKNFLNRMYSPEDIKWLYSGKDEFGNVAVRRVNTIFDYEEEPFSNMVLGEVLNNKGNWSGYLPHRHPQPEVYFFKFDRPEGFGASFVGDQVFKSVDNSFAAIPGGCLHPQATAPGFQMYTCWMIRHFDGNPWLQTDRCEDERYTWLHER
ncbi:5-deoxy-glucuronate isomerase [Muricomes sp. OA1]|uniref:5-deoxyglucuronate isomerase n=1 Tax=Hungatella hathewayi TaxID=154046 RepID=A0A3E2WZC3_9FIRM|nr:MULTISPECIES: 5-deoxy-glucuronate isomerase [Clostridia]MCH1974607.1 5-deoxy-glucuronate isomerase [Muricomes sp. OA1]RGC33042.1 5-deoxyglucuronate isomerase [Hungatella hathewayi]GKH33388.1 5-deoxy-glucuronate isomerase [Faecalicatena contorta]